jgi:WhiB family redox-sensing transcriptional regulator
MNSPDTGVRATDWTAAQCRDHDPELFFPVGTGEPALRQVEEARTICTRCAIGVEWLEWALASGIDEGI